jgi:hypothetical protein
MPSAAAASAGGTDEIVLDVGQRRLATRHVPVLIEP